LVVLLSICLQDGSAQNYNPSNSLPAPTGVPAFGPPFNLIGRVLNFAPFVLPDPFNGFDDVNVHVVHNLPSSPFYEQCSRITTTQNIPPVGNSSGWYQCEFTMDDDGTDLMQFAWSKTSNPNDGVTTFDAAQIQIVAASPTKLFVNPYSNIAADVIVDGKITSSYVSPFLYGDVDEVIAVVLGIIPNFTQVPSWRFVPAGHLTLTPTFFAQFVANPFATSPPFYYPIYLGQYATILYAANPNDHSPGNLVRVGGAVGVKMGDVNFSNSYAIPFAPPPLDRSEETNTVSPRMLKKGTIVRVSCALNDSLQNVIAWQAGLRFDDKKVSVFGLDAGDMPGFGKKNYNIMDEAGEIRALWIQPETKEIDLAKGTQIFNIVLELQQDVQEGEALLTWNGNMERAFYRLDGNKIPVNAEGKVTILSEPLSVSTNPNPFKDFLVVKATGGEADAITVFILLDLNGREVAQTTLQQGQTEASIQTSQLPDGIYVLKTTNDQQSLVTPVVKL
jgi:hypothetical protein